MSSTGDWQPISKPTRKVGAEAFTLSPFARLARTHAFSIVGDALVVLALADSLFFSIPTDEARWRVFGYLALTVAPFAVVAPLIGPALDRARGGRRWMVVGANGIRAVVCVLMLDSLDSLLLFPLAFTVLVMGKGYGVARSALVPTTVRNDAELVEANSKLQLLSGIGAVVAAVPGGLAILIAGSRGALVLAALVFVAATFAALRIPATQVSAEPAGDAERAELRGIGILLAASAMALIRGTVGFLTFLLAFELRDEAALWQFGVVLALTAVGGVAGAAVAPALRRSTTEERMLMLVLGLLVACGLIAAYLGGVAGAALLGPTLAVAGTTGKLGFDSLVQRDAPDANRGRSFARFETRFQLAWVVGAALPVVLPLPVEVGFVGVAAVSAFALFSYVAGQRAAQRTHGPGAPAAAPGSGGLGEHEAGQEGREPTVPEAARSIPDPWGFRSGAARPSQGFAPPDDLVAPPAGSDPAAAHADPTGVSGAGPWTDPTTVAPAGATPTGVAPAPESSESPAPSGAPAADDRSTSGVPAGGGSSGGEAAADGEAEHGDPSDGGESGLGPDLPDLRWSRNVPGARASDPRSPAPGSTVDPTELQ